MNEGKNIRLLTGKELLARMQLFVDEHRDLIEKLRVSSGRNEKGDVDVHVIRCIGLDKFIEVLGEDGIQGLLANQHDAAALLLVTRLEGKDITVINVRGEEHIEIDAILGDDNGEVKTMRNIDTGDVPAFIAKYYGQMVKHKRKKGRWWLVFMLKRSDAQATLGRTSTYYMIVMDINVTELVEPDRKRLIREARALAEQMKGRAIEEDGDDLEEIALEAVQNIWALDLTRERLKQARQEIAKKDEALAEKDEALAEKDESLAEKDAVIAELKRKLDEK